MLLYYQKKQVKRAVKWKMIADIDKDELVLLKLSKNEQLTQLHWEHAREFSYKGEMYDIVYSKKTTDSSYYWCWWDHEETKLNKQLKNLVRQVFSHNPLKKDRENKLLNFYKNLYFPPQLIISSLANEFLNTSNNYTITLYSVCPNPPPKPPPESQ
ncbi:MAG TPA: hypothetical protein DCQ58_08705 [Saprospirales bacterium]|nr:hypothetical protein [Saprospirales bacterium]